MRTIEEIRADIAKEQSAIQIAMSRTGARFPEWEGEIEKLQEELQEALEHERRFAEEDMRKRADLTAGIPLDCLEEICVAFREQRYAVFPIKPNTKFFYIDDGEVHTATLDFYQVGHLAIFFWSVGVSKTFTLIVYESGETDIGKTVFLTPEAAKASLEEAKNAKTN